MTTKILLCLTMTLLFSCLTAFPPVYAETVDTAADTMLKDRSRNIYVGDIIALEISAQRLSDAELHEKFIDFEIVSMTKKVDRYLLSLRTFEPGDYTVLLGDKEIIIQVRSTLSDIQRDAIFEGDTQIADARVTFPWYVLFYIATGVFLLSAASCLIRIPLKRKTQALNPYLTFLKRAMDLAPENDHYFVMLTYYFKTFLESLYQCQIIGKTSAEIMQALQALKALDSLLPEIQMWLAACDRLKFSGVAVTVLQKKEQYNTLLELAEKINTHEAKAQNEGVA